MGWQDRDYVRSDSHGRAWGGARSAGPIWARYGIVTTLIAVNVVIYALGAFSPTLQEWFYGWGALQGAAVMRGQVWRLLTAQYLHIGAWHLLFNMLTLHFLGRSLESMWSIRKFFVIYTLCGLFGNVFYTFLAWRGVLDPYIPAVGASGSIYGLVGIVAVMFPTATVYIQFLFPVRIRTAAIVLGAIAFITVLERGRNYGGEACHLAGLLFGVWWAMRGDAWWSRSFQGKSAVSRVGPASSSRPIRSFRWWPPFSSKVPRESEPRPVSSRPWTTADYRDKHEDEQTVDRILKKVYEGGIHSLTESEKNALRDATERQRKRESQTGR